MATDGAPGGSSTKRLVAASFVALVAAVAFGGCGELIGVGSLSGGGPDASAEADATAGGGARGRPLGAGGTRVDSGMRAVVRTAPDARAPKPSADAERTAMGAGGKTGSGGNGEAPVDAGCIPGESLTWIHWSGATPPDDAYVLGGEPVNSSGSDAGYFTYYVCRAHDAADNVIPGTFVAGSGCYYTPDGTTELQAANFDVLANPLGCFNFPTYSGSLPASALTAGNLGKVPLYVCFAAPEDVTVAGYLEDVPNATCRVPYRTSAFDVATGIWLLTIG